MFRRQTGKITCEYYSTLPFQSYKGSVQGCCKVPAKKKTKKTQQPNQTKKPPRLNKAFSYFIMRSENSIKKTC